VTEIKYSVYSINLRRPRPTQGCRADDDDNNNINLKLIFNG
jgi:hypothetical protein